jgi:hypothetical protein
MEPGMSPHWTYWNDLFDSDRPAIPPNVPLLPIGTRIRQVLSNARGLPRDGHVQVSQLRMSSIHNRLHISSSKRLKESVAYA